MRKVFKSGMNTLQDTLDKLDLETEWEEDVPLDRRIQTAKQIGLKGKRRK